MSTKVQTTTSSRNSGKHLVSSRAFKCSKCDDGEVEVITKETKDYVSMEVKKCSVCKHQWGLKQILSHGS